MSTVRQYYDSDFKDFIGPEGPIPLEIDGKELDPPVLWKLLYNYDSKSMFVVCYTPEPYATSQVCSAIIQNFDWIDNIRRSVRIEEGYINEPQNSLSECMFTNRLIIYAESQLSSDAISDLQRLASERNLALLVRDRLYKAQRDARGKPIAFISHDFQDKDTIARPLAINLNQNLCKVWYDEFTLKVGDSLRTKIEEGLKDCKKCILILTPNFLNNEGWGKREFDSIFTREIVEKENLILPIWAGVHRDDVFKYSSVLADRKSVNWDLGIEEVTTELLKVLL